MKQEVISRTVSCRRRHCGQPVLGCTPQVAACPDTVAPTLLTEGFTVQPAGIVLCVLVQCNEYLL